MNLDADKAVELVRELLKNVRHGAMATVNQDGSPHNTPYFFMYNPEFTKLFWGSHQDSLHSKNIAINGKVYVVVYDSFTQGKGGLYITASNARLLAGQELKEALGLHNSFRVKYDKDPLPVTYYTIGEQGMYSADIHKLEVHTTLRDDNNLIKQELRTEIAAAQLTGGDIS